MAYLPNYTTSNLVIVGNGFDLAHGLETGFKDFIKYLIKKELKEPHDQDPLFDFDPSQSQKAIMSRISNQFAKDKTKIDINLPHEDFFKNIFFMRLIEAQLDIEKITRENWSDIELFYFQELKKCLEGKQDIQTTNDEFEIVKKRFEEYLLEYTKNKQPINSYQAFFDNLSSKSNMLVLNFNYTDTVNFYVKDKNKIINIHGELQNDDNPMIFGYAAEETDRQKFYSHDNFSQFLLNIKQERYGDAISKSRLDKFWEQVEEHRVVNEGFKGVNIFILGHSCGVSDSYILNQIVNHKEVKSIRILYHENVSHHRSTRISLKKVMKNPSQEQKILNVHECRPMPQLHDDDVKKHNFTHYYLDQYLKI